MSFIANNPIMAAEATSPPPLPKKGTRGLFPKEDGWYDYDEMGNVTRIATSAELKKISENSELVVEETVNSGVAKSYVLKQGEIVIASIDIPLDMVVSGGAVETYTNDNLPPTVENPGTYIVLTIANSTSDKLYININDLVAINEIADDLVTDDSNKVLSAKQGKILNDTKVDKVDGKDLSANDFTDELKSKLENIDENATEYVHPETHPADMITGLSDVATSGSYNDLTDTPESIYLVDEEGTLYLPEGDYRPAIKGDKGDSVHIRYSEYSDGTDFTTTWSKRQGYLGVYIGQSAPTEKEAYQWVLFREDMKPVSTIPSTLETNTSYNFGEVTELNLSFPTDAIDGDIIYITFTSGETATNLIIDTTNTSDFELIPEVNSGYEICAKFNGVLWILSDFEYTYTTA